MAPTAINTADGATGESILPQSPKTHKAGRGRPATTSPPPPSAQIRSIRMGGRGAGLLLSSRRMGDILISPALPPLFPGPSFARGGSQPD